VAAIDTIQDRSEVIYNYREGHEVHEGNEIKTFACTVPQAISPRRACGPNEAHMCPHLHLHAGASVVSFVVSFWSQMRILAVDHGEKHLGLAVSDPTGTIAGPLRVIKHVSRPIDAAQVAEIVAQSNVELIVVGQSFDEEGHPNLAGRRAARFAEALKLQTQIPIVMWDESLSTRDARAARLELGVSLKRRQGHLDEQAAVVILQSYLDANQKSLI
jgi:putative Holliday junction resolvase